MDGRVYCFVPGVKIICLWRLQMVDSEAGLKLDRELQYGRPVRNDMS